MPCFTLFDTALGRFGIAWSDRGLLAVQLPETDDVSTEAALRKRVPDLSEETPPPLVAMAIGGIQALCEGAHSDFADTQLDLDGVSDFDRQVYAIALEIPPGKTMTYGEIARRLGDVALSRDVGQALGRNPIPVIVPCHRVVGAGGRLVGFSAPGGVATKHRLLAIEGAFRDAPMLFGDLPVVEPRQGSARMKGE
ncbi:MAG: methylated-DNA--[protein]-cysteine S-methyltransferase [Parvibaculaceae bacterium]